MAEAESQKLFNWIASSVGTVVLMGGGFWLSAMHSSMTSIQRELLSREGRISRLEAVQNKIAERLDRIEDKLDLVLSRIGSDK